MEAALPALRAVMLISILSNLATNPIPQWSPLQREELKLNTPLSLDGRGGARYKFDATSHLAPYSRSQVQPGNEDLEAPPPLLLRLVQDVKCYQRRFNFLAFR